MEEDSNGVLVPEWVLDPFGDRKPYYEQKEEHGEKYWYCLLCNNYADEGHRGSAKHKNKEKYAQDRAAEEGALLQPVLFPWLMYAQWDDEMCLRCVWCKKWVTDDETHRQGGPKEHLG